MYNLIELFRSNDCYDTFVIYTGYELYEEPLKTKLYNLQSLKNIILKTGRYIPNHKPHFDEILGINLASDNQKGVIIC